MVQKNVDKRFQTVVSMNILLSDLVRIICDYCGLILEMEEIMKDVNIIMHPSSVVCRGSSKGTTYRSAFKSRHPISKIDFPAILVISSIAHRIHVGATCDAADKNREVEFSDEYQRSIDHARDYEITLDLQKQTALMIHPFHLLINNIAPDMCLYVVSSSVRVVT